MNDKKNDWAAPMGSQTRLGIVLNALKLIRDEAVSLRDARDIAAEALKEFENGV